MGARCADGAAETWSQHTDDHGQHYYFNATLGRSSWTHPRRDAFLQRYIALKVNRDYNVGGAEREALGQVLDGLLAEGGGGLEEARAALLDNVSLSAQLLAERALPPPTGASDGGDGGGGGGGAAAALDAVGALLQPLLADIEHLQNALRRAMVENADLEKRLQAGAVQLRLEEERRQQLAAQAHTRASLGLPRAKIGRRATPPHAPRGGATVPSAAAGSGGGYDATVRLVMSSEWTLFEGPEPACVLALPRLAACLVPPVLPPFTPIRPLLLH
eukprot:COSAG01_NODE_3765_length_5722_cov_6.999644_3_plen_274_part_00